MLVQQSQELHKQTKWFCWGAWEVSHLLSLFLLSIRCSCAVERLVPCPAAGGTSCPHIPVAVTSAGVVRAAGCSCAQGRQPASWLIPQSSSRCLVQGGMEFNDSTCGATSLSLASASHLSLPRGHVSTSVSDLSHFPGDPVHQPSFETAPGAALSQGQKQPQAAANTTLTDTLLSISRVCLWLSCLEQPVQQPHECKLVFEGLVMRHVGSVKYSVTILNTECFPNAHKANCLWANVGLVQNYQLSVLMRARQSCFECGEVGNSFDW